MGAGLLGGLDAQPEMFFYLIDLNARRNPPHEKTTETTGFSKTISSNYNRSYGMLLTQN
jgi:hypothetical protein